MTGNEVITLKQRTVLDEDYEIVPSVRKFKLANFSTPFVLQSTNQDSSPTGDS